jgi:alanine racemase
VLQQDFALKLDYRYADIEALLTGSSSASEAIIRTVAFDSRRIVDGSQTLFFALSGPLRDGHAYVQDAYARGVRHFVVQHAGASASLPEAREIVVPDSLRALQTLAAHHRSRFKGPVIAITGSNGKTIVKEWLCTLLQTRWFVSRSPKSYNSQLGVALSLLELQDATEIAVIEVGISAPGEMETLRELVKPTHGIFTAFGAAHRENFPSEAAHLDEKLQLFMALNHFLAPDALQHHALEKAEFVRTEDYRSYLDLLPFSDRILRQNAALAIRMALELGLEEAALREGLKHLHPLAMRMEQFDGIDQCRIINDTYSLDKDSLRLSLEYQLAQAGNRQRLLVLGFDTQRPALEAELKAVAADFAPLEIHVYTPGSPITWAHAGKIILFKGMRAAKMEQLVLQFKLQHHQTYLEIDLSAVRHNIHAHKSLLKDDTQILCMVKASSYGSDARTMGKFLESTGVNYLGVAYADEGVELRNNGVSLPILVMNCEESTYAQCIAYQLEPAFYSLDQLNRFVVALIDRGLENYPVHIKLETGMHRLGFAQDELRALSTFLQGQPEIRVQSVYSHLADADNPTSDFTRAQIERFSWMSDQLEHILPYRFLRHLANSAGIRNFPEAQFDMVRLGIGMYGADEDPSLEAALAWYSQVSQVKTVEAGESVGYNRQFVASARTRIAIVPVGYADGFRRTLSEGKGGVYIREQWCPTVGRVCMDMIMVDVTQVQAEPGDTVEIIGKQQHISAFAKAMGTIPYEVMTGFSARMHRVFIER